MPKYQQDTLGAYTLLRSERKTLVIHIKNGQVFIKAPLHFLKKDIETWVKSKKNWIDKHLLAFEHKKQQQTKNKNTYDYSENAYIPYMGGRIQIKNMDALNAAIKTPPQFKNIYFDGECLYIKTQYIRAEYIEGWYKQQAYIQYKNLIEYWQNKMQLYCKEWGLSHGKKRLGYCTKNGKIAISWYLIMQPLHVIEYVIIHEIAHLLHFNHSKNFWLLVEHYCVNYSKAINYLRTHGILSVI